LYRAPDLLCDNKEKIEDYLFNKNRDLFNMSVDLVLYDVTSLYFESKNVDELKNFGYSKDCKFSEVQVILGLLVDLEGRPVGYDLFPGNTYEGHTLRNIIDKLKYRFKINRLIFIADQGMLSKDNLKLIKDKGYEYIIGSRIKNKCKKIKKEILNPDGYKTITTQNEEETFKFKKISLKDENLLITWSRKRAKKDKQDRERLILKAEKMIEQGKSNIVSKRGFRKYINISTDTSNPALNKEKILEDKKWDGYYGIQTNSQINTPEILLEYYHKL
jgi:transposase